MGQNKDHTLQAIDTLVPDGEIVNEDAWRAMRDNWREENPDWQEDDE